MFHVEQSGNRESVLRCSQDNETRSKDMNTNYGAELLRHIRATEMCFECEREFDLTDEEQANEFYYGHDCEAQ